MKNRKKTKFKKLCWLSAGSAVLSIIFILLLLYKPAGFTPPRITNSKEVSKYVTHVLSPQFYNGVQREEPFELIIPQNRTKDIVELTKWPKESDSVIFSAPKVFFVAKSIVLMGTAAAGGVEFVVTVVVKPSMDEEGFLNLRVAKVKIGAMNITPLVKAVAKRMYQQQLATTDIDTKDIGAQIVASLLNDEPFEPVFKLEDKNVRIEEIIVMQEKLIIRLVPAPG